MRSNSVHLTHLKPDIFGLDTLAIWPSSTTTDKTPYADASNSPCEDEEGNHDGAAGNLDRTLSGVVSPCHTDARLVLEFTRPGLEIKSADVVPEEVVIRIVRSRVVRDRCSKFDIAVAEARG